MPTKYGIRSIPTFLIFKGGEKEMVMVDAALAASVRQVLTVKLAG